MKKTKLAKKLMALFLAMLLTVVHVSAFAAPPRQAVQNAAPIEQLIENQSALITRGEFAMLLNYCLSLPDGIGDGFIDVPTDHQYAIEISKAQAIGYMKGDGLGNFRPDAIISGAQAAVCIDYFLGFDLSQVQLSSQANVPAWAQAAVSNLLDLHMISIGMAEIAELTVADALDFINALMTAALFPQSPYALMQARENDDFYAFHNRRYLATASIAPGYPYAMSFLEPQFNVENQIALLLTNILDGDDEVGSEGWKIAQLHEMYMDEPARAASLDKIIPIINEIKAVKTIEELNALAAEYFYLVNMQAFYVITVSNDAMTDATKWCVIFAPGTFILGTRDYYADSAELASIHNELKQYICNLLAYVGETEEIESRAEAVFLMEQSNALASMPLEALYNPDVIYTKSSWGELDRVATGSNTTNYSPELREILENANVYCPDLSYIEHVEAQYIEENLEILKDFAIIRTISTFGGVIGDDFSTLSKNLSIALYGMEVETMSIEQRAQSLVMNLMGSAFSKLYAETYATQDMKADVSEIIELVRDKFRERINNLDWMSESTKLRAIEKLESIKAYVAYPDDFGSGYGFNVTAKADGGNLVDFLIDYSKDVHEQQLEMLKQQYMLNLWSQVPTYTVNAFYSPTENAIIIPAGILQEPFYSKIATREENLGAIGAVIAHEISHAFDNNGAKYDKNGTITDWWNREDYDAFDTLTGTIASVLSEIPFVGEQKVNGLLCTGETIADLGAMACVLDIADDIDGADLGLVMEAWNGVWAARMSPEVAAYLLSVDNHLPHKLRVNFVLSQLDDFYVEYNITETDGMYVAPEDRISIW